MRSEQIASALLLAVACGGSAYAAPARRAPAVKHTLAFDGRYAGTLTPDPGLSGPGCAVIPVDDFIIDGGVIKPSTAAPSLSPVFDGFVTDQGFITGHMRLVDTVTPFEARAEVKGIVTVISGGIFDDKDHCDWVVNLTIQ